MTLVFISIFYPGNPALAQTEGAYRLTDGIISDYQPRIFELPGSRSLMIKHSRYNWDSSWVSMTWFNNDWEVIDQKTHRLTLQLTFVMDAIMLDDGFVMCGVMPSSGGARFIMKTDTSGAIQGIDHPELPLSENIHCLIDRGNNEFTAYSSSPLLYQQNYRMNGNLSTSTYSTQKITASSGYSYQVYRVIEAEPDVDLVGGKINPMNGTGDNNLMMKMNSSGTVWVKSIGFSDYTLEYITSLALEINGNCLFTTYAYSSSTSEVAGVVGVTDSNGNPVWCKKVSIPGGVVALYSAKQVLSGDILVCGTTGTYEGMLLKLTDSGDLIWKRFFPNTAGIVTPFELKRNTFGKISVGGYLGGDSFIWQLDAEGNGCGFIPDDISVLSEITPTVESVPAFSVTSFSPSISPGTFSERNLAPVKTDLCLMTANPEKPLPIEITIFPNPATDLITIQMPADNEKNAVVTVADIQGRIHFQDVFEVRDGMMRIRLNHLDSGIYFLSVSTEDFDNRQKILITR
jgi:hypothetical protein